MNPNANPRHHFHHQQHQHLHHQQQQHHNQHGNVQGYSTNQSPSNQMDKRSSCSRSGLNSSIPSDISASSPSNSSSSSSSSYGASTSSSFPQQHQFYSETAEVCYTPSSSTSPSLNVKVNSSSSVRQNQNFSINNSMQFYSNENRTATNSDSSCYFVQQQQLQATSFDCDHQSNLVKNSVVGNSNSGSVSNNLVQNPAGSNSPNFQHNFYSSHPSYNSLQPNHTQQIPNQEYHHNNNLNTTSSVSPTTGNTNDGDYSRFHGFNTASSNINSSSLHHPQEDRTSLSCQQESTGYFDMLGDGGTTANRHVHHHTQQPQQNHSPYGLCQNPSSTASTSHQIPFRRNSIESFSSSAESGGGDLSYSTKYGCNNFNNNIPFGLNVIKRETGIQHPTSWSTTTTNNSNSNNNTFQQHHEQQQQQHHQSGYFFNNTGHRHASSTDDSSVTFEHTQQPFQNFKSCSFDTGHSEMDMEEFKVDLGGGSLKTNTNTGSSMSSCSGVKHRIQNERKNEMGRMKSDRSLSCSMMTSPYQFSITSDDSGHFNFLDGIDNHNSNSNSSSASANVDSRNINVPGDSVTVNQKYNSEIKKPNGSHHHHHHSSSNNNRNSPSTSLSSSGVVVSDTSSQQQQVHVQDSKLDNDQDFIGIQEQHHEHSVVCESTDCCNSSSSMSITFKQEKEENNSVEPSFEDEINSNIQDDDNVDSLIISTTTATLGDCCGNVVHDGADKCSPPPSIDDDGCSNLLLEALDEADGNSSCSLGLFANNSNSDSNQSLNHLAITGTTNETNSDYNDNESCHSAGSSCNKGSLSDICLPDSDDLQQDNNHQVGSSTPLNSKHSISPQKISKRSFSEADKDLVINTTAVSFRNTISIPDGWKREICISSSHSLDNNFVVYYTSPSGTKLRTWDELKNYICSDGTCKCGLSCPLRLEQSFSFDPKVTNSCQEEESLLEENETGMETPLRLLCNHKRRIPKSEDSPLISSTTSTRDDLGECGDHGGSSKKKCRISGDISSAINKVFMSKGSPPISTSSSGINVSVPFSQQSPDTTTQTPQTDMSPVSSVSSEQSVVSGNRSTNSTPTPTPPTTTSPANSGKNVTVKVTLKGKESNSGNSNINFFPWPQLPASSQSQTTTSPTTTTMTFWPSPNQTTSTTSCSQSSNSSLSVGTSNSNASSKKSGFQHHLTVKGTGVSSKKRANSPCPNIDVRQIPLVLEQNRPPRQTPTQIQIPTSVPSQTTTTTIRNDNPSVSFFPISTTAPPVENQLLNTGYSISPVIPNSSTSSSSSIGGLTQSLIGKTLQFTPQQSLQGTTSLTTNNVNILSLPIQFQRLASSPVVSSCSAASTTNTLIHQSLPNSITISMVGGNTSSSSSIINNNRNLQISTSSPNIVDTVIGNQVPTSTSSSTTTVVDNTTGSSDKSPLQMVQDVVDRFQSSSSTAGGNSDDCKEDASLVEISTSSSTLPTISPVELIPLPPANSVETVKLSSPSSNQIILVQDNSQSIDTNVKSTTTTTNTTTSIEQPIITTTSAAESNKISVSTHQSQITVLNLPLSLASTMTTSSGQQQLTSVTTTHNVNVQPIVTSSPILNCATSANVVSVNPGSTITTPQQIILQQPQQQDIQSSQFLTTTAGGTSSIRYPVFQTIQPIFLNSTGNCPGGQLIISPQPSTGHPGEQQSFIYEQPQHQTEIQPILQQTTMVLDPSVCGIGSKKKKKRLSKKQQQQQAQLHLQQQLLLQQLAHQQAQVQQVAQQQQTFPLTIFPQSFNLGPQGFSLQPMNMNMNMNFFPTSTILTLPNLILNPADGTLFLQPSQPLQTTASQPQQVKLGQFPIAAAPANIQQTNIIAPKKDGGITLNAVTEQNAVTLIKTGPASADVVSDDSRRQNATPDSSTNDCQLGLNLNPTNSITISLPSLGSNHISNSNTINIGSLTQSKKVTVKSRAVSSSSGNGPPKRTQKQILPKIDSTTTSVENS